MPLSNAEWVALRLDEPSTGGVEESCDSATIRCQPVVCRQRNPSLLAQDRHATCFKQRKCLRRDTQQVLAAAAEDYQIRLVDQQLFHVSAENTWSVICAGFAPIPRSPAAGPKFGVAEPTEPLYFDEAPTVLDHSGRRLAHTSETSAPASGQKRPLTRPTPLSPPTTFRDLSGSPLISTVSSRLLRRATRRGLRRMRVLICGAG